MSARTPLLFIPLALSGLFLAPSRAEAQFLALRLEAPGFSQNLTRSLDQAMREELIEVLPVKTRLLPPPAVDYEALKQVTGCPDDGPACLASIGRTAGAKELMRVVVAGTTAEAQVSIVLVDVASGRARTVVGELLDLGTETFPELKSLVAQAFGVKRDPPPGRVTLYVASSVGRLEGAEILVDDKPVEASALERLPAGKHRVEVRQKGFESFAWVGTVRASRETRVGVTLTPVRVGVAVTPPIGGGPTPPIAQASPLPPIGGGPTPPTVAASAAPSSSAPPTVGGSAVPPKGSTPSGAASSPAPVAAAPAEPALDALPAPSPLPDGGTVTQATSAGGPSYVGPVIIGAAAIGVLVFGIVQGARMQGLRSDLSTACSDPLNATDCLPNACDAPSQRFSPKCSDARSAETLANVGLIGGGVLAATALTWALVELFSDDPAPASAARLNLGPGSAEVRVAF